LLSASRLKQTSNVLGRSYPPVYSFYRPTKGGRLSRPRHCRKGAAARAQDCVSQ